MPSYRSASRCAVAFLIALFAWSAARAQSPPPAVNADASEAYVVEYYYKLKWGHQDEFIDLFKRNHFPLLKRLQALGYIREISAAFPVNHAGENKRWDFRVTIVFKNIQSSLPDDAVDGPILKELFPDQTKFKAEEQRRFELIEEHMDVPIFVEQTKSWG